MLTCCRLYYRGTTFTTKVVDIHRCTDTKPPHAKHKKVQDYIAVVKRDKKNVFSGNTSYLEACADCKWSIDSWKLNKGRKHHMFRLKDMDCNHLVMKVIFKAYNMLVNPKTCEVAPGTCSLAEQDLNQYDQDILLPVRTTGCYEYSYRYFSPKETHSCWIVKVAVETNNNKLTKKPEFPPSPQ